MSTRDEERKGICILSFDSGGPGTYSQLLILKEYMSRLANDLGVGEEEVYPADYFDLMGGVGFGGLVSIILGHLRMNVDDAIDALITVAIAVFGEDSQDTVDLQTNSKHLKDAIEEMLQTREISVNSKMYERDRPRKRCKVVLYAATSADINHPQAFRTYSVRGSSPNTTIVEAVCATMAVPSLFLPVKIGPRLRQQSFIGGAHGANNPTRELLKEASAIFGPNRRVAQVLSIGSGLPRVISVESSADSEGVHRLLKEIAMDCEIAAQELSTRLYTIDAYLRLNMDRGMELVTMTNWNELGSIESHTAAYIATAIVTGALDSSERHLQERTGALTLEQINQSSSIKIAAKTAPAVSPYFVLRTKEWEKLVWHLIKSPYSWQRILAITGMGGCGKTQMVSYFLREYPSLFRRAVFVDASTLSSIKADLQAWARVLGDGHERDIWEDAIRILSSAQKDERWALILDNADDPTLNLVPFMPKNVSLTIIITSRNRNLGNLSTTYHMELGEMEPDEALATLLHAARRQLPLPVEELKSAHTLLKELGCLAVALVQAGTYCRELSCSFIHYLSLFKSHRAELMKKAEPSSLDSYERGAYTTLDLSYEALPQASRDFLHFISFFHHTAIPLSALATAAREDFEDLFGYLPRPEAHKHVCTELRRLLCVDGTWSKMRVQEILRTLRSFSLLSISSIEDSLLLQLHPLTQAWSRDMDPPASQHHRAMTLQVLTVCCRDEAFQLHAQLLPHILDVLGQLKDKEIHINDSMAAGKMLNEQGHYQLAEQLFERALESGTTAEPSETRLSSISLWLASVYRYQGRWSRAEELQVGVLEQRRRILRMEHPHTILAAAELASTYHSQGRWGEAEKLEVDVSEQRRRILGMDHPDTISAAANLASTYRHQGRWSEAEKLEVDVLERRRRILGVEHPYTILATANLASTYRFQGRWSEAEKLGLEVLEQQRRILGVEHPHTISAAAELASTCRYQGRWSEAEKLEVDVLERRRRILGAEHAYTILAAANLASTYRFQGRWSEAEKLGLEVLEQQRRILGVEHPHTISAAAELASTYHFQGRWGEAEKLEVGVLEQRRRILGMDHPDTILVAANLASIYRSQGRWSEAEKLGLEVSEQRRRILEIDHPHAILVAANLASTYRFQGRWSEAEKLGLEVLEQQRRILGVEHPHTISAAAELASTYYSQGRWGETEKLIVDVLERRRNALGMEHPDTILAAANLASIYGKQSRWEEDAALLAPAVQLSLKVLGQQHPDTQMHLRSLVFVYGKLGKEREAQELRGLLLS